MFQPKFIITPEINTRIAEIERLRTIVNHAIFLPELEIQLRFRATVEAVHSSTSIEGNPLNELQVQKVLRGESITAPDYAIREVLNYKQALDWLNNQKRGDHALMPHDILDVHALLMKKLLPQEKTGHWRSGNVYVIDEVGKKEVVRYTGPDASDVLKLVSSLLQWVDLQHKSSLHPVLLAGILHYIFVSIHPFADGNGRTTRLLTFQYLKIWDYDFRGTLSLDTYYLQHQSSYYDALDRGDIFEARMQVDLTPFLDFFTKGFLNVAQNLSQYVKVGKVMKPGQKPRRLSSEELTILDYAYQFGSISMREAVDILSATTRTAQRRLMELVEKDILIVQGRGPATYYVLRE